MQPIAWALVSLGFLVVLGALGLGLLKLVLNQNSRKTTSDDDVHAELTKLRREVAGLRAEWATVQEGLNRLLGRVTRAKGWDDARGAPSTAPQEQPSPPAEGFSPPPVAKTPQPPMNRKQLAVYLASKPTGEIQ